MTPQAQPPEPEGERERGKGEVEGQGEVRARERGEMSLECGLLGGRARPWVRDRDRAKVSASVKVGVS